MAYVSVIFLGSEAIPTCLTTLVKFDLMSIFEWRKSEWNSDIECHKCNERVLMLKYFIQHLKKKLDSGSWFVFFFFLTELCGLMASLGPHLKVTYFISPSLWPNIYWVFTVFLSVFLSFLKASRTKQKFKKKKSLFFLKHGKKRWGYRNGFRNILLLYVMLGTFIKVCIPL